MTDHAEEARQAIAALREEARRAARCGCARGAAWYAAELALRTRATWRRPRTTPAWRSSSSTTTSTSSPAARSRCCVCALAERGAFDEAHELLRQRRLDGELGPTLWEIGMRHARARLWLAEGDFERAHAEAVEAGALRERAGPPEPGAGRRGARPPRSRSPTSGAATRPSRWPTPSWRWPSASARRVPIAGALHARAVAEADDAARVALCERALAVIAGAPAGLRVACALRLELGSALAYVGRRVEARDALRPALADADAAGAVLLAAARAARARGDRACARGRRRSRAPRR